MLQQCYHIIRRSMRLGFDASARHFYVLSIVFMVDIIWLIPDPAVLRQCYVLVCRAVYTAGTGHLRVL